MFLDLAINFLLFPKLSLIKLELPINYSISTTTLINIEYNKLRQVIKNNELTEALSRKNIKNIRRRKVNFIWPAKGTISSRYGKRRRGFHSGIDIAARNGTPIRASANGVVVKAGWGGSYGRYIDIKHSDGSMTRYAHSQRLLVRSGQYVFQGQIICLMGSSGRSTGSHLHFEVYRWGRTINPISVLK